MSEKKIHPSRWRHKAGGDVWDEVGRPSENEVELSGPLPCRGMRTVHREVLLSEYEEVREVTREGMASSYVRLWDAIGAVVQASGGDTGNTSPLRQLAVAEVDRALASIAREYVLLAGREALVEIADVEAIYDKTRHRKFTTEIAMLRQRVERRLGAIQDRYEQALDLWNLRFDFATFADEKAKWSAETFGPGDRYAGVVNHIRKELEEIEANPSDLSEWVDVILLAMDGAWRSAGADGEALVRAMLEKQQKNTRRRWPDWRTLAPGQVSEHDRSDEG